MYNNKSRALLAVISTTVLSCSSLVASAAVSEKEAARLQRDLTPLGAERAGNAAGTIPAWTGGYTQPLPGDAAGGRRSDPFKDEQPLYTITVDNMNQYADQLTDGVKAMLQKYPDSYHLNVYPTHRTASAPQWVYDNIAANASRATLDGHTLKGAYGGVPFPIAKTGLEAIKNHILGWAGSSWEVMLTQYQITSNGRSVLTTEGSIRQNMPYYFQDGSVDNYDGMYWEINLTNVGPPIRAGEMIVGRNNLDADKSAAYVYLTGQRRVRRLPNACCDTPAPATAGLMSFDEVGVFSGRTDLFDWKLLGKQEILVPYNQNRFLQYSEDQIITDQHLNPAAVRWELHRVWVVEATLAEGKRHRVPKSKYYLDEDTWQAVLGDRWDGKGQLWKTLWGFNYVMPDFPGTIRQTFGYYDLLSGEGYVANVLNDQEFHHRPTNRWPTNTFTGQGLAAQGVR